ncbi:hypothetical protein ACFX11_007993 [Malus domestica]
MGVVEAMQHSESSRRIASLNGSHSEGRLGRSMENGECSFRAPNLKRRTVSAVRDFPLGCGRFGQLRENLRRHEGAASGGNFDSVPTENLVGRGENGDARGVDKLGRSNVHVDETDLMNGKDVGTVERIESVATLEHEISDLPNDQHGLNNWRPVEEAASVVAAEALISGGNDDDEQGIEVRMVPAGSINETALTNGKAFGTVETVDLNALLNEISDSLKDPLQLGVATPNEDMSSVMPDSPPNGSISISSGNGLEKTAVKKYPPRRVVSAIRDFPPLCGRNPALEARNFGQERSTMDGEPSSLNTAKTTVRQTGEDVQDREFHKSENGGDISLLIGDKVQPKSKGHAVQELERHHDVNYEMNVVSEDAKKIYHELSQGRYIFQGTGSVEHSEEKVGMEMVVYHGKESPSETDLGKPYYHNQLHEEDFVRSEITSEKAVVMGLMTASNCPWRMGKVVDLHKLEGGSSERKRKKLDVKCQIERSKAISRKKDDSDIGGKSPKNILPISQMSAYEGTRQLVVWDKKEYSLELDQKEDFYVSPRSGCSDVCPPPFGTSSSTSKVRDNTRNTVRETLRLFQALCRKLLREEEGKSKEGGVPRKRVDYSAAKILKDKGKYVNTGKQILGTVPGVEVGDEFHYRVELTIVGLHRQIQGGIDYVKHGGKILATSIVASGGYADDLDNSSSLIYTGQGGNVMNTDKEPEDQKLERGNLALKNSLDEKNPVRVIRGSEDGRSKTYVYDGLYLVQKCWQDMGSHGKLVFKFQLDRVRDQPELAWKEVKKSKKYKVREGLCIDDISGGKESIPICAVNTIDDEKPPTFVYITSMIYPDWCRPVPPKGCTCIVECSDSEKCSCAVENGGEIPYNFNGAIVEAKSLVYECGPSCKCPPSCYNRVSQRGIKFQLEIFKTESRGWGVRSLNSIPSGSFICEYIGELLEEKEAEERTGNDEYLFDIGNNYSDNSLWDGLSILMPDAQSSSHGVVGEGGFTIDAVEYGNVGRFINHSCSPNLYAQNVLYDHDDTRIPHIMFFAAENIPPLQELTYHYNYMIDQVRDSNGKIKKKSCYCGSPECTGRLY